MGRDVWLGVGGDEREVDIGSEDSGRVMTFRPDQEGSGKGWWSSVR